MGARNDSSVFTRTRGDKSHLLIDFLYRDAAGRQQRYRKDASVQTLGAARAEAARLKALAAATGSVEAKVAGRRFSAFVDDTFEKLFMPRFKQGTRIRYRGIFKQVLVDAVGGLLLEDIDGVQFRTLAAGLASRSIHPKGPCNLLRTVLRAAVEVGELEQMPNIPKKLWSTCRKLPDAPSEDEVQAMLEVARGWIRAVIALGAFAGLRVSEARALEVRDVDFKRATIHLRQALSENELSTLKSGHDRIVPLIPELAEILRDVVASKLPRARVILNEAGNTPTRQAVWHALQALLERHDLPQRSVHSLRHAFCSVLIRRGASVEAVRLLAGHSDLQTTQRYVHAQAGDLRAAMATLVTGWKR
jgi:integrase